MKRISTLTIGLTFATICRVDGQSTEAYVKWGNAVLESTSAVGEASAYVMGYYTIFTNEHLYGFNGQSASTTDYRHASVGMTATADNTYYENQIAGGSCTLTDVLSFAGSSSTGIVRYLVEFSVISVGAYADLGWSFSLTHNGAGVDFSLIQETGTPDDPYYSMLLEATNVVAFGQPFTVAIGLTGEINVQAGDPFLFRSVSLSLLDAKPETLDGVSLETVCALVGQNGFLAPQSSPLTLHVQNQVVQMTWPSLTGRFYQAESASDILAQSWMLIGPLQQGTGTNNSITCTNSESIAAMRVIEQY